MEISTARRTVPGLSCDTSGFALHPIVALGENYPPSTSFEWNEALIRPGVEQTSVSPSELIDTLYAGDSLATDIAIFKRISTWLRKQRTPQRVSINIHPDSLTRHPFVADVMDALHAVQCSNHSICLELVEFGHCSDRDSMITNARMLRRAGALIALDDFGTRLNFFDLCGAGIVDVIKIDLTVTDEINACPNKQAVAYAIKTLADGLGAFVVAEGIETHHQLETLRDIGIAFGQGYFFQHPVFEEGI